MSNNQLVNIILLWGSIAGAIAAIIALIAKIIGVVKKVRKYFNDLRESVNKLLDHDKEQYKQILKLTVMTESMPLSERIGAAEEYFKLGGNGEIKKYYREHLKPFDHIEERS